uniref:PX domain-containing protein n=1 Tax=Ditylenchus dipsaci TaxID=166011 RepID=A0A915EP13_9BILA
MEFIANYGGSSDDEDVVTPRKHKFYTVEFKLKVLKHAKEVSNKVAAEKFGVHRKRVQDWVKQEMLLHKIKESSPAGKFKKKLPGGGRPLTFKDLDIQLAAWLRERRSKKLRVSNLILQQQAVKMFNAEEDEEVICGITISHDGSEDDHIHCFKEDGPIPEGPFELMVSRSAIQQAAGLAEEVDKEQDDENGYLSDESLNSNMISIVNQQNQSQFDDETNDNYRTHRTEEMVSTTDNETELFVDISDALSERDKVKYTVHTKTKLPEFAKQEMSVVREHGEFIWLHNCLENNENFAGFIIPPAPPRPDFDASREKLQKLGEGEATMTKEEFQKMKQELEQEYLATFKKTVAMHEVFLCRLAAHPIFSKDPNFRVFLEYDNDLLVRGKNKREIMGSLFKRFSQSADEVLLSGQKDIDDFFEHEKNYLVEYHTHIKEATGKADRVCRLRRSVAECYSRIASNLEKCGQLESTGGDKEFGRFLSKVTDTLERLKKAESRVGTDEELKETDTLRYFTRETSAAKDLLYRRLRCLANYEAANKNLERARARNREIQKAETEQAEACKKFEEISALAKTELVDLKKRRVEAFKKNLTELVDLEIKQSKNKLSLLQTAVASLKISLPNSNGGQIPVVADFSS